MKSNIIILCSLLIIIGCTTPPLIPPGFTGENPDGTCVEGFISFEHQVLPVLVSNCAMSGCHDEITREDGVVLTNYENVMKDVTPYSVNGSELYKSMITNNDIMPPPPADPMQEAQLKIIRDWINQGAMNTTCLTDCDSTQDATFAAVVYPIIETACVGCHNDNLAEGGVKLNVYAAVKASVDNGGFMGTIEHEVGYSPMPPSGVKLSDCQISLLNKWITNGALDN
jgi:hypothetical protein